MSAPGPFGSARPGRVVGLALIGVAVVALGLGAFALTSNGSGQSAQGRPPTPPSSSASGGPSTTSRPPTTSTTQPPPPAITAYPSGQTTTIAPPPQTTTPPPPTTTLGPAQPVAQQVAVRVYNNSLIKGLAQHAAQDFRDAGFSVVEVGNYSGGTIPTSTVYYTSAPGEQQTATTLAQDFNLKVAPRFQGIAFASPGVIAIITNDYQAAKK